MVYSNDPDMGFEDNSHERHTQFYMVILIPFPFFKWSKCSFNIPKSDTNEKYARGPWALMPSHECHTKIYIFIM